MAEDIKPENLVIDTSNSQEPTSKITAKGKRIRDKDSFAAKRRCVSTACIACRRRKSKCDGNTPSCAACASVYGTECVYDPNSDHRRKGVYKKDIDNLKTRNSTLQILIQAILNKPEDEVADLVRQIRTCESLDDVAERLLAKDAALGEEEESVSPTLEGDAEEEDKKFETELSGKMGELRLENGSVQFLGGTSNLIFLGPGADGENRGVDAVNLYQSQTDLITSWTNVTADAELICHLLNLYFTWHYTYFTTLSKQLFFRDFNRGKPSTENTNTNIYCTSLLVNAMLTLGCHFTTRPDARADPNDSATAGNRFFKEAKRLLLENDEHENPRLPTVQALALMSVREAGCGREAKGWVYSGMSFRMAYDLGLNVDSSNPSLDEEEIDARRITFWGCFLFDKCWSNYLGRQPQLPMSSITVPKFDIFPTEDAATWFPFTESGFNQAHGQPARTRTVALQISNLCEISSDLLAHFYHPNHMDKPVARQVELKKLSELHTRLEAWRNNLPKELDAKEGSLPSVLVMHMFFQLLFIHLFRPFLRYNQSNSPLPAHVSPRKFCTQAAAMISKLIRLYKRTYGLRQICNIAVYIAHSACTIHLLNLPEKNAKRDIIHGVKHLEEIAESWLCARRTLSILKILANKWKCELPEEAATILDRADVKYGYAGAYDHGSPKSDATSPGTLHGSTPLFKRNGYGNFDASANGFSSISVPSIKGLKTEESFSNSITATAMQQQQNPPLSRELSQSSPPSQQYVTSSLRHDQWPSPQSRVSTGLPHSQASPSALFGSSNHEAAVAEGHEWWLKDQADLAMDFENWSAMEAEATMLGQQLSNGVTANLVANGGLNGLGFMNRTVNNGYDFNGDLY